MLKEKEKLLDELSQFFLNFKDPTEAYFRLISRLNRRGIDISVEEVQRKAYECEGEVS